MMFINLGKMKRKRKVVKKTARRRTYTRYRAVKTRARRAAGASFKPMLDGLMAGFAGQVASKYVGGYGHPAASIAVGMFRHNNVLVTEGARELGAQIAHNLPFFGNGQTIGGGVY
jgi:hypothetical protein